MSEIYVTIKDRANPERVMKFKKDNVERYLVNLNRNGKRKVNGQPQFYLQDGSEEVVESAEPVKKKSAVKSADVNVYTKTEFSPERIKEFIQKAQTIGALERLREKVGDGYDTEIAERKAELESKAKAASQADASELLEPKPNKQTPAEPKPKAAKKQTEKKK